MATTTPTLTPLQRLMADEPVFFKIIKFICVGLLIASALMEKFKIGSSFLVDVFTIGGTVGFGVASFVVKEANLLITQGLSAETVLKVVADIPAEIDAVKTEVKTAAAPTDLDTTIKDAQAVLNNPAT